ncbi:MAG: alkaline phosphatase [Spirochaetes bacterium]|nr:alkaline phosphatase [Spirochaetota bacterium]
MNPFRYRKFTLLIVAGFAFLLGLFGSCGLNGGDPSPRNIILFIGDGMGEAQVRAGSYYATGMEVGLSFQQFPVCSRVTTFSADNSITDSAAAATAIATGKKVNNGVLSVAIPGDGKPLETILELAKKQGKRVGIVTTTSLTHATPAAFAAHQLSRTDGFAIAQQMLYGTKPDLLFGGGGEGMDPALAQGAGYRVVTNKQGMVGLTFEDLPVSGQFGISHMPYEYEGLGDLPHLSEMTRKAFELLSQDTVGFFLVVEGGRIDHAAHRNDIQLLVREVIEFSRAIEVTFRWAKDNSRTLIVVTSDHETGGLQLQGSSEKGQLPEAHWTTTGHTGMVVPLYAWGPGSESFKANLDNTEIHTILYDILTKP